MAWNMQFPSASVCSSFRFLSAAEWLRSVVILSPGAGTSTQSGSSEKRYARVWAKFVADFCRPLGHEYLPISAATWLAYIRWQAKKGTVHQESLSRYLSVLNLAMEDYVVSKVS